MRGSGGEGRGAGGRGLVLKLGSESLAGRLGSAASYLLQLLAVGGCAVLAQDALAEERHLRVSSTQGVAEACHLAHAVHRRGTHCVHAVHV